MLGWFMKNRRGVAVAGTHGKTTTTSLISSILTSAGLDPTTIVGGEAQHVGGNAKAGHGDLLVAEADESDGSFLMLPVRYAVITNVDNDHLNYYGSEENLRITFQQFVESVSEFSVLCGEDPFLYTMKHSMQRPVFCYGFRPEHDYQIKNVSLEGRSSRFELFYKNSFLLEATVNIPGLHNVLNSAGAAALCHQLKVEPEKIVAGLAQFCGVQRRFELIQEQNDIMVFDDYAHHPTEVKATLDSARNLANLNGGKLVVCFQPHRYTRNKELAARFAAVLSENIDFLYIAPIYSAGEKHISGADSWSIYRSLTMNKSRVMMLPEGNPADWAAYISGELEPKDILLTVGAGNVTELGRLVRL
jgi:UDP-N-acetylmuramate--alanine ligase